MGYQPRKKSPKGAIHEYKKAIHQKGKIKSNLKRVNSIQEKSVLSEKEIFELTLKRLHVLAKQKFGSFPFSAHFDRWLLDVEWVLKEFQSNPNIGVDDQFVKEYSEVLANIKRQLEKIRAKEASVNQEVKNVADNKNSLEIVGNEYLANLREVRVEKILEIKRSYNRIEALRKEEQRIMRLKAGFFRSVSEKEKERKEAGLAQAISFTERQVELAMMDLKAVQKKLREAYEAKREPLLEKQKQYLKRLENFEEDGSLEERWFTCEALIDAVSTYLQRKSVKTKSC